MLLLYAVACVGSAVLVAWDSMPRLATVAFPAFAVLGTATPSGWRRKALLTLFAFGQVVLICVSVSGQVAP